MTRRSSDKHPTRRPLPASQPAPVVSGEECLLDGADRLFPCDAASDLPRLADDLAERLLSFQKAAEADPTANPVLRLSLDISDRLARGDLAYGHLEQVIQRETVSAFADRARRLSAYIGETSVDANTARVAALLRRLTMDESGTILAFDRFRARVEGEVFGVVVTAHPTFSIGTELLHLLNRLSTETPDGSTRADILQRAGALVHRPDPGLSLNDEHALSLEALGNIRAALHRTWTIALNIAREVYPDRWTELSPRLVSVASWVGYDLDGRSDISFADMLARRLQTQARQVALMLREVEDLPQAAALSSHLKRLGEALEAEIDVFTRFDPQKPDSVEAMRVLSRHLNEGEGAGDAAELLPLVQQAIAQAGDDDTARRLIVLRAELRSNGLALARTHVRINSVPLHNAIRPAVGLETTPDDPRYRQTYMSTISRLIAEVQPVTVNFGSLLAERTSAKRLFMTVAQMLKYTDGTTPVRFLIAECESAFTPLVALYYARMFGVSERLEICPLFETEKALQLGSRIVEQLIENPHFRLYLTRIGRLCVQTGYSDAGRFIGQPPATGSIERLKERIVHAFERHRLDGVELVFFDTHGESVGRGGHPQSLKTRLDYVHAPHIARLIIDHGIAYKQESSFQGGDGYVYFLNEAGALSVLASLLEWRLTPPPAARDPYYGERDYVTEFLTSIKEFQNGLVADPDYGTLLGTYGSHLLYKTGSRAVKRNDSGVTATRPQISQFRAIPHNAVLQQLGMLTNTLGGAGEAITRDPARFRGLYGQSERFRTILDMVRYADAVSEPDTLKAYVDTLDPGLWLLRAASSRSAPRALSFRRIADVLEQWAVHGEQVRVFRHLFEDFVLLRDGLQTLDGGFAYDAVSGSTRMSLALLNAIRLAIIQEIYVLGTMVPEFSSRGDAENRRVFMLILQLAIPEAVDALRQIFPSHPADLAEGDFGEPATYQGSDGQTYARENAEIFTPMLQLYELLRRIGTAISHRIGFIG